MSRNAMDPGLRAVRKLFDGMRIDERWSTWSGRGYTWWGHHHAQRVWAETARVCAGRKVWRVHAETDLVRGCRGRDDLEPRMAELMGLAGMSGLVRDEGGDLIRLRCSASFDRKIFDSTFPLFALAAAMQAAEAESQSELLADLLGLDRAVSDHPISGTRPDRDDMLNVIDALVIPQGRGRSKWAMTGEFSEIADLLNSNGILASADANGLSAEFPFGENPGPAILGGSSALLVVETRDQHPRFGHGISLRLHLPIDAGDMPHGLGPLRLNELERNVKADGDFLGSWRLGPNPDRCGLLFTVFVPNTLSSPGRLLPMVLGMGLRAKWAQETVSTTRSGE